MNDKAVSGKVAEACGLVSGMTLEEKVELGREVVKNLKVLELSALVKALEEEFGVSAQAPVAVQAVAVQAGGAAVAGEAEKKDTFDCILTVVGEKKIQVIKEVRALTNLGLKEAKTLVEEAPKPLKQGVSEKEAQEIKAKLEAVGASVEIK